MNDTYELKAMLEQMSYENPKGYGRVIGEMVEGWLPTADIEELIFAEAADNLPTFTALKTLIDRENEEEIKNE